MHTSQHHGLPGARDGAGPALWTPQPRATDAHYRQRAARRRFGTRFALAALAGLAMLLAAGMIYVIAMVLTLLANMLGQQATGRIEERFDAGKAEATVQSPLP